MTAAYTTWRTDFGRKLSGTTRTTILLYRQDDDEDRRRNFH